VSWRKNQSQQEFMAARDCDRDRDPPSAEQVAQLAAELRIKAARKREHAEQARAGNRKRRALERARAGWQE
jgi:hypothetical protein